MAIFRQLMTWMAILTIAASESSACPAYLPAKQLPKQVLGQKESLHLFAVHTSESGQRRWHRLPLQIDPLDENGVLRSADLSDQIAVEPSDRISFRRERFGEPLSPSDAAPCLATTGVELRTPGLQPRFAYLVACEKHVPSVLEAPVAIDADKRIISAPSFQYEYLPSNQLMYKKLVAFGRKSNTFAVAAQNSEVNLRLNIRRFFTLNFTNRNIESYVQRTRVGEVGVVGSIDFFLRLLFFKVDLKMATTAGFYEDSSHIPSIIDVPRDASSALNAGSGLLYLWQSGQAKIDLSQSATSMPVADPKLALSGWERQAQQGLPYCRADGTCVFSLRGQVLDQNFGIDINIARDMVARGFYPTWVPHVGNFKKQMGWDSSPSEGDGIVGVYFENSGLLKGQHRIDQWIRIGSETDMSLSCPLEVVVGRTTQFSSPAAH